MEIRPHDCSREQSTELLKVVGPLLVESVRQHLSIHLRGRQQERLPWHHALQLCPIEPDGSLGIRQYFESPYRPGERITMDDYYGWMFENSVPGLPAAAASEGLTPLAYMRKYGATREDFGKLCVAQRQNALKNPNALFKKPLTMEEYLNARPLATPVHLFDAVMPCAGADAFLVMRSDDAEARGLAWVRMLGTM